MLRSLFFSKINPPRLAVWAPYRRRSIRNRELGTVSFYDSQSGQHVEVSDEIFCLAIDPACDAVKTVSAGSELPTMTLETSPPPVIIEDAFAESTTTLQMTTGKLADAGYTKIILKVPSFVDADELEHAIEECVWNDVEGLPMLYRLGLRFTTTVPSSSLLQEQVKLALRMNIKHFEAKRGADYDALTAALDDHGALSHK